MTIDNHKREDGLSTSLQFAKAGEHLVCATLLLQGHNAFMADAGLPYDLIVDRGGGQFWRVQVKSTCDLTRERPSCRHKGIHRPVYRFAIRRSRCGNRRVSLDCCDYLAFAALDFRQVAFMRVSDCINRGGDTKFQIEFKTRRISYRRVGISGPDPSDYGKFIEDYSELK